MFVATGVNIILAWNQLCKHYSAVFIMYSAISNVINEMFLQHKEIDYNITYYTAESV